MAVLNAPLEELYTINLNPIGSMFLVLISVTTSYWLLLLSASVVIGHFSFGLDLRVVL